MKTSNTQIAVYNMSTIRSILSCTILFPMDLGGDSYTSHFYATFDVLMLISPRFKGYQVIGQVINDRLMQI